MKKRNEKKTKSKNEKEKQTEIKTDLTSHKPQKIQDYEPINKARISI